MRPKNMELNDEGIDWMNEAPLLKATGKEMPFQVPAGYFDELSGQISRQTAIPVDTGDMMVPENYFDELTARINSRIAITRFGALPETNGFTVPENYFAGLSDRIRQKIDEAQPVRQPVRRLSTLWIRYAAAACLTMIVGTMVYFNSDSYKFDKQLSEVSDQEIINYLQVHSTASDTPFIIETLNNTDQFNEISPEVSADELEEYINSTSL